MTKGQDINLISNQLHILDGLGAGVEQEAQQLVSDQQAKAAATMGNTVYFQQAQLVASSQLRLEIQQAITQDKANQDKEKNNGNLVRKGTTGSTSMVVAPTPDIKKKMDRKQPGRIGDEDQMDVVSTGKGVTPSIAIFNDGIMLEHQGFQQYP